MKKLVAISVLLAGLAAAVFAQEESKWKFGFETTFITDMLYMTSASGKSTSTTTSGTVTKEFGNKNKGTIIWFDNANYTDSGSPPNPLGVGTSRMLLSVSNSGENYEVYADIVLDDWQNKLFNGGQGVLDFLSNGAADWYLKGSAGIFEAQIGTNWFNTGGWVSPQPQWGGWYRFDNLNRFGVWRQGQGADTQWWGGGWLAADTFRTWPQWGASATIGIGLGDNYKFTLGYNLNPGYGAYADQVDGWADAWASKSSINGTFLLSGKPVDALTFDLFYSILGKDDNTFERPDPPAAGGYTTPGAGSGFWRNIAGVYLGLNIVENLGLSLGYTANFNVFDAGSYLDPNDATKADARTLSKKVTYNAPIYSGIDLHLSYSGIDKIGLTFNNNISLAGVKGEKVDGYKDKVTLIFDEKTINTEGWTQDWFHWDTMLKVSFGFIEGVDLALQLGNQLGVKTDKYSLNGNTSESTETKNTFLATLGANYGVGAMTFGVGLIFQLDSEKNERTSNIAGSSSSFTGESNVVTFGIPIIVKVAF